MTPFLEWVKVYIDHQSMSIIGFVDWLGFKQTTVNKGGMCGVGGCFLFLIPWLAFWLILYTSCETRYAISKAPLIYSFIGYQKD